MIRDIDHQLCEQRFGSLIPGPDRTWLHLSNTQAEIPTVTLPSQPNSGACEREALQWQDKEH